MIAVGFLALGAQAVVLKLLKGKGVETEELLPVLLQTAPLTLVVAILALAALRKWYDHPIQLVTGSAFLLLGATVLGSQFGFRTYVPEPGEAEGWIAMIHKSLAFYWRLYGPSVFFSALIFGVFLGWAANKLWPPPADKV